MGTLRNFKAVMHLYVRGIDFISVSTIFQLDFGTVPTMWYFLDVYFIVLFCIIKLHATLYYKMNCNKFLPLLLQDTDDNYWVVARSEEEARQKAATKFNVSIDKITLKQGQYKETATLQNAEKVGIKHQSIN